VVDVLGACGGGQTGIDRHAGTGSFPPRGADRGGRLAVSIRLMLVGEGSTSADRLKMIA
jgi:hypothetical protein